MCWYLHVQTLAAAVSPRELKTEMKGDNGYFCSIYGRRVCFWADFLRNWERKQMCWLLLC